MDVLHNCFINDQGVLWVVVSSYFNIEYFSGQADSNVEGDLKVSFLNLSLC